MPTAAFHHQLARDWTPVFEDPGDGDWREHWLLDGLRADIRNTPDGMVFAAGPIANDNASHAVLWTRQDFSGDVRIEFEFTRLDTVTRYVNILYIQASSASRPIPTCFSMSATGRTATAGYFTGRCGRLIP